jgi:hypothetical protein
MEASGKLHTPAALPPGKGTPGTHCIGCRLDPRAGLDTAVVKRKIPSPRRESNPRTPIVQLVAAQRYTDWAIPARIQESIWKYIHSPSLPLSISEEKVSILFPSMYSEKQTVLCKKRGWNMIRTKFRMLKWLHQSFYELGTRVGTRDFQM